MSNLQALFSRGNIANALALIMWASDFLGHPAAGSVAHDPHTAVAITAAIGGLFQTWAVIEHFIAKWQGSKAKAQVSALVAAIPQTAAAMPARDVAL